MNIIKQQKFWLGVSTIAVIASLAVTFMWGLNLSIDFTGGALMEISFLDKSPEVSELREIVAGVENVTEVSVQPLGDNTYLFRLPEIENATRQNILNTLGNKYYPAEEYGDLSIDPLVEKRFESVGPIIGQELKSKSINAIAIALIAIVIYVAWAFRKVSRLISSWKYGVCAIIALFHDIVLVTGVFAVLGHVYGIEVGVPFVAALLTILGYSVNDTIVIFDRIRENLLKSSKEGFEEIVNRSILESVSRSLNTSLTTLFALLAIFVFGGETIRFFVLALTLGCVVGTYSSIFVASSVLVAWQKRKMA